MSTVPTRSRCRARLGILATLLSVGCNSESSLLDPTAAHPATSASGTISASFGLGAQAVPFNGRFGGSQTVTVTFPTASVEASVAGTATHLGRFTMELPHTVNLMTSTATGTATLVAANGDVIVASFTGQAQLGPIVSIVELATVTGGTGRFAGATGSFTITRGFDPAAGRTTGSFSGSISSPGF